MTIDETKSDQNGFWRLFAHASIVFRQICFSERDKKSSQERVFPLQVNLLGARSGRAGFGLPLRFAALVVRAKYIDPYGSLATRASRIKPPSVNFKCAHRSSPRVTKSNATMGNSPSTTAFVKSFKQAFDKLFGNKEMRVVMLGLDAAGKTTILYKLHIGEVLSTVPTLGALGLR